MKKKDILTIALIIAAVAVLAVFDLVKVEFSADQELNGLLNYSIPRICAGVLLTAVVVLFGYKSIVAPDLKHFLKDLLWCVPCFLVVLANFPFTALIGGTAKIERVDLIWLFIIKCLAIGLMEEMLFRGLLQNIIGEKFNDKKYGALITVAVTSAIFGGIHLLNLFAGAGAGATFLQVGYSFLIGAMFSAVLIKTKNIWLCVFLHAAFDFGGLIVTDLGTGTFQDMYFWIFTAVAGAICFAHIFNFLLNVKTQPNND